MVEKHDFPLPVNISFATDYYAITVTGFHTEL